MEPSPFPLPPHTFNDFPPVVPSASTAEHAAPASSCRASNAPVGAIAEIRALDGEGVVTVLDTARVWIEADMHRPILRPRGSLLPNVPGNGAIMVRFSAGIAADWAGLPVDLRHAVLMLATHYYEYRDDTSLSDGCMPFGVTSLIQRYRPLRLTMGAGQ